MLIILFYHVFLFLLIIDLYFLTPAIIAQIFSPIAELAVPIGIPSKEPNAKIEITEAKIRKFSIQFRVRQTFICLLLINSFCSISPTK